MLVDKFFSFYMGIFYHLRFSIGDSDGHEADIRGKGKTWKEGNNNAVPLKGTIQYVL